MNRLNTLFFGISAGTAICAVNIASPASAADLPVGTYVQETPVAIYDAFDWNRFYAGIAGGYGASDVAVTNGTASPGLFTSTLNLTGGVFGLTAGRNFALPNEDGTTDFVFGIEGDFSYADLSAAADDDNGDGEHIEARIGYLGTLRARAGIPLGNEDRFMPFITGGLAIGYMEGSGNGEIPNDYTASASAWLTGWTVGGGVEIAVADQVTLKAEYLYSDLAGSATADPIYVFGGDTSVTFDPGPVHVIRAGLNAHF